MRVTVNGEPREVAALTVAALLDELGYEGQFFAIALNQAVLRRPRWVDTRLQAGDEIEILTPRQGG